MSDHLVDVFYCGLPVGTQLSMKNVGPTSAFLELPNPMPVGTIIDIAREGHNELPARVMRVQEQVKGVDHAPGMHIRLDSAPTWWSEIVHCEDPVFTREATSTAVPANEAIPEPVEETNNTTVAENPTTHSEKSPKQKDKRPEGKRRRKRRKKQTTKES